MLVDIMREFKVRKENNNTIMDILNMFWLDKCVEKEFFQDTDQGDFPEYFNHPEDTYYF